MQSSTLVANYYICHSILETQQRFHCSVEHIRNCFIDVYGISKKEYYYRKRQDERSNHYQEVADYYLQHTIAETMAAFDIEQKSLVTHYFRRAYQMAKGQFLKIS